MFPQICRLQCFGTLSTTVFADLLEWVPTSYPATCAGCKQVVVFRGYMYTVLPSDVPGSIEMLPASGFADTGTNLGSDPSVAGPCFFTAPWASIKAKHSQISTLNKWDLFRESLSSSDMRWLKQNGIYRRNNSHLSFSSHGLYVMLPSCMYLYGILNQTKI